VDILLIPLPRGRSAIVQLDQTNGVVTTSHAGLQATVFQKGVKDLDVRLFLPCDGRAFLSALYDHLFLRGYHVRWLRANDTSHRISQRTE
jgi:hypothetical protein